MLPITQVIIYKHGVAYFQREGTVTGDTVLELSFKADQMNDVLKSLTTLDFGEGSFSAISYDSEESTERRLAELSIEVPKRAAITEFLDQLKGVDVRVTTATKTLEGAIIGIEELACYANSSEKSEALNLPHLALLTANTGMTHTLLQDITSIQFTDDNIQRELNSLMETLAGIARNEKKRLSIQTIGKGERQLSVSYVVEAPVWKTSYRIIILDTEKNQHLLQGWAVVDNTSEEDWQGVNLTLVSGLPISFRHDLYSPRYQERPEIRVSREAAVAAPLVERGMQMKSEGADEEMEDFFLSEASAPEPLAAASPSRANLALKKKRSRDLTSALENSSRIETHTEELGDLFSYEISQPVNIKRGQSALVPILQANIEAEKILYYNKNIRDKNPMSSFLFKNSSGLTLEGGPITVYEGQKYLGEAMLDTLQKQEEKVIPYSVELAVNVNKNTYTREKNYTKVTKGGSYIHKHRKRELVSEYIFDKKSEEPANLILDHAFTKNLPYENDSDKPSELLEITDNFWRYRIKISGKGQTCYEVVELDYTYESITLPNLTSHEVSSLISNQLINSATAKKLEAIAVLCEKKRKQQKECDDSRGRYEEIVQGQERLRKSIQTLGRSTEEAQLRARYVAKLNEDEDILESLTTQMESLAKDIEQLSTEINIAIDELDIDKS